MRDRRRREAFTLIELLVVIGIIAVLMAILIPVVGKVRLAATTANVTNKVHQISAAIGNYFHDFNAYPGTMANRDFTPTPSTGGPFFKPTASAPSSFTQSEDLLVALLGGFELANPNTDSTVKFVTADVGLGPVSYNRVVVSPRKSPYTDLREQDLTPQVSGNYLRIREVPELEINYTADSEVPEFIDSYSARRPILYMRANAGATTTVFYSSVAKGSFDSTAHYDVSVLEPYLKGPRDSSSHNDFHDPKDSKDMPSGEGIKNDGHLDLTKQWVIDYFTDKLSSGSGNAAKGGGYLLIDAGPDRAFGTVDDIVVGAGGGQ